MEELLRLCADFIKNFDQPINYDNVKIQLTEITLLNYQIHDIPIEPNINFEDLNAFAAYGKVSGSGKITFNKKRIETLIALDIDCFAPDHLERIWDFYHSYDNGSAHNIY